MAEPDPRQTRLTELRHQLEALGRQISAAPVGSPERDALLPQYARIHGAVLALADELADD
jgi:hypothetical protein